MQLSLFYDYHGILDSSSFHRKYDALFQAFELAFVGPDYPMFGRKGYAKSAYLKALIFKQSENIKHISDLIRRLDSHPVIAMTCGFPAGSLPDASQFSRFLSATNNSEIEELLHRAAKMLIEKGHVSTDILLGDSKPIKANTPAQQPEKPQPQLGQNQENQAHPGGISQLLLLSQTAGGGG